MEMTRESRHVYLRLSLLTKYVFVMKKYVSLNSAPHELRHTHKHTNVCMNSSFFLVSLMYSFLR